ncbi:uncharacterized protein [Trachinotus anak]|uniref:uncharacterized protein n=1 Tax=Trachinotus anak TaxID=443729 RepID=UPI0039F2461D
MSHKVFFIKLLLVHYIAQSQAGIQADCSDSVSLSCPADDMDNMDFLSVTWYKLNNKGKVGIIRRSKGDNVTQSYRSIPTAEFGEKYSLLLPSVKPEDSGTYDCAISANIGQQNQNFQVDLTVHECVTQAAPTTAIQEVTPLSNTTQSILACHKQGEELPVMWSVIVYVAVSFVKIILSVISIWVIDCIRSSKQQQRRW